MYIEDLIWEKEEEERKQQLEIKERKAFLKSIGASVKNGIFSIGYFDNSCNFIFH